MVAFETMSRAWTSFQSVVIGHILLPHGGVAREGLLEKEFYHDSEPMRPSPCNVSGGHMRISDETVLLVLPGIL